MIDYYVRSAIIDVAAGTRGDLTRSGARALYVPQLYFTGDTDTEKIYLSINGGEFERLVCGLVYIFPENVRISLLNKSADDAYVSVIVANIPIDPTTIGYDTRFVRGGVTVGTSSDNYDYGNSHSQGINRYDSLLIQNNHASATIYLHTPGIATTSDFAIEAGETLLTTAMQFSMVSDTASTTIDILAVERLYGFPLERI